MTIISMSGTLVTLLLASLGGLANASGPLSVYTVNYPLQYFAERIGGDYVSVAFPAPAGVDPAQWTPDPATIAAYQNADLILLNGAGYARWVDSVRLPAKRTADTSAAFKPNFIAVEQPTGQGPGVEGEPASVGVASVTWLDLFQATQQAQAVMQALADRMPERQAEFEQNLARLRGELMALDLDLQRLVARNPNQLFLASQPVYQYFARRYAMKIQSVSWQPEAVPDETQWEALTYRLEDFSASWMLWEAAPNPQSISRLKALGVTSLVLDPCANRPAQGDFISVMKQNRDRLRAARASRAVSVVLPGAAAY